MKKTARRLLSFALASTIMASVPVVAHAQGNGNSNDVVYEDVLNTTNYIVKEGDTLGKIAEMFYGNAAYYEYLANYNHMDNPALIFPGQIITIPNQLIIPNYSQEATIVEAYPEDTTYTVQRGDTLYCIVRVLYGLTNQEAVDKLATYNNLSDPNKLVAGQVLIIPCLEKLQRVVQNDYTEEYNRMGWKLNHPGCTSYQPAQPYPGCDFIIIPVCPNTVIDNGYCPTLKPGN